MLLKSKSESGEFQNFKHKKSEMMISRIFGTSVRSGNRAFLSTWSHNGMDDETFAFMRDVLAAPSPVGLEAR